MKHYLTLLGSLLKNNFTREAEYRGNFFLTLLLETGSLLITILIVHIQFSYTTSLAGWSKGQVVLLVGVFKTVESLIDFSFMRNIRNIPNYVEQGELDLYLAKPVSAQFLASFRYLDLFKLSGVFVGGAIVFFAFLNYEIVFSVLSVIPFLTVLVAGIVIFYSLFIMIASFSFWTTRLSAISNLYYTTKPPLSVPMGVFGSKGKLLLTYLVPLMFVVTIPAGLLSGRESLWYVPLSILMATLFFLLSRFVWNTGLKRYSGASS